MASSKQYKTEEAEAVAKHAAKDLEEVNREKRYEEERTDVGRTETDQQYNQQQEERPGVIGTMLKAVEHVKEVVVGKSPDTTRDGEDRFAEEKLARTREVEEGRDRSEETTEEAARKMEEYKESAKERAKQAAETTKEKAEETKESAKEKAEEFAEKAKESKEEAKEKAQEYADSVAERAKQAKDATAEKAKEAKDTTVGKAAEYKDYAAEKAREAKDTTVGKAAEYKDYAAEKAREAKDTTVGKAAEYKDYAEEKARDTKEAAAQKAGEVKEKAAEKTEQGKEKLGEFKDNTAEKAKESKDTTVSKLGELKDSAAEAAKKALDFLSGKKEETKEKVAETGEKVEMEELKLKGYETTQKSGEYKDTAAERCRDDPAKEAGEGEEVLVVTLEETRPGYIAAVLQEADQETGQTFNKVGRIDDEGIIRIERKDRQGKMSLLFFDCKANNSGSALDCPLYFACILGRADLNLDLDANSGMEWKGMKLISVDIFLPDPDLDSYSVPAEAPITRLQSRPWP
ncbi:hypothetical protein TIFTF001_008536 [Ficus carica]|uniref:Late embryogenesis abundant protein ECP63-like domain-containing protein n=1 Tax=Ficus carica TaxID=3494 RepID=A0AA88D1T8_FICCA|nr:hypothetical protein TIFTF001_008536 [Ficus carica]